MYLEHLYLFILKIWKQNLKCTEFCCVDERLAVFISFLFSGAYNYHDLGQIYIHPPQMSCIDHVFKKISFSGFSYGIYHVSFGINFSCWYISFFFSKHAYVFITQFSETNDQKGLPFNIMNMFKFKWCKMRLVKIIHMAQNCINLPCTCNICKACKICLVYIYISSIW